MKFLYVFLAAIIFSCSHSDNAVKQKNNVTLDEQEVEQAEANMFNAIKNGDASFWQTGVSDSYISINADGTMTDKQQTINDSARRKMFIGIDHKLFDKRVRFFENMGICTGRAQFFMQAQMVAEIYYTAIFRKENNNWLFEGWQGTLTKNQPAPPPPPKQQ